MVAIDPKDKKYIVAFKPKNIRPNQRDDKVEIFRSIIGLEDVRDILDLNHFTGHHMTEPIRKSRVTVTDINAYKTPFVIARLSIDQVQRLRKNPNVEYVEEEQIRYIDEEIIGYQVPKLQAGPQVWDAPLAIRGSGVNVAIIDTGCDPHIDLPNLRVNQNFGNIPGFGAADDVHHGTHCAGIAGAAAGNNEGIQGIAPGCNIWNLKGVSLAGPGPQQGVIIFATADLVECIVYCTQNNAHVVSMSLSGPVASPSEQQAITAGFNTGNIVYVAAAGNETIQENARYPAAYPGVISISNLNETGTTLVPSSSRGPYIDFTVPGHNIISLGENNLYRSLTGTSMSCPGAAGVCALMYSAWPGPTGCPPTTPGAPKNQTIENVLRDTATKSGLSGAGAVGARDNLYGFGLLQARAAVAAIKGILPSALA